MQKTLFETFDEQQLTRPGKTAPPVAKARRTDPATSHAAASEVETTGAAAADRARVANYVFCNPGLTAGEIAKGLGWVNGTKPDNARVTRRVSELVSGLKPVLKYGDAKQCSVKGTKMQTVWEA